jgi:hypothetical protein
MNCSDLTDLRRSRALLGTGCPGPAGPAGARGPGVEPLYASFLSSTTQPATTTNPVAITYSERTIGTIDISGNYPNSQIIIPLTGVYRVLFSAQCDSSGGNHWIEIFPVINGTSVPKSNTRARLPANTETCLVVEYILSFTANDLLELYMIADNTNARLLALTRGSGTPAVPNIPSIIVNINRIE